MKKLYLYITIFTGSLLSNMLSAALTKAYQAKKYNTSSTRLQTLTPEQPVKKTKQYQTAIDKALTQQKFLNMSEIQKLETLKQEYLQQGSNIRLQAAERNAFDQKVSLINQRLAKLQQPEQSTDVNTLSESLTLTTTPLSHEQALQERTSRFQKDLSKSSFDQFNDLFTPGNQKADLSNNTRKNKIERLQEYADEQYQLAEESWWELRSYRGKIS